MALIYITGSPGIGKSTIQKDLRDRGFEAYDIDGSQFGGPHSKASGERVIIPRVEHRDDNWFDRHEWRINRAAFEELKEESRSRKIIICGVAESDTEVIDLFDKIIYLHVSDNVLKERLTLRAGNDYGKNISELNEILLRKKKLDEKYKESLAHQLDASGALQPLIDNLLDFI